VTRDERGSVLVELVWLGILLLVPLVYLMLSVFEVQRGAFAVSAAARAAGRAYAVADTDVAGERAARAAAAQALADQGLDGGAVRLRFSCAPADRCREPGSVITVVVESSVRLPLVPDALGGGAPTFALDATHSVPRGRFNVVEEAAGARTE
jgi:Flp pilus assembly protein TadG